MEKVIGLEDRVVELVLLKKKQGNLISSEEHNDENGLMTGCTLSFGINMDARGQFVDIFTKHAGGDFTQGRAWQAFLEKEAGFDKGYFSVNDINKDYFWKNAGMIHYTKLQSKVAQGGLVALRFNLLDPIDYVKYLICKYGTNIVAPSWKDREVSPYYRFALRDTVGESNEVKSRREISAEIVNRLLKLRNDNDITILRAVYNMFKDVDKSFKSEVDINEKSTADDIYYELFAVATNQHRPVHIDSLNRVVNMPEVDIRNHALVLKAIAANKVSRKGSKGEYRYYDEDGALIGRSLSDVIAWLNSEDQSDLRVLLTATVVEPTKLKKR